MKEKNPAKIVRICLNSRNLRELYINVDKYTNSDYTMQQCYSDLLDYQNINAPIVKDLVIAIITKKIHFETSFLENKIIQDKEYFLKKLTDEKLIYLINWLNEKGSFDDGDISLDKLIERIYPEIEDTISKKTIEIMYKELLERQNLRIKDIKYLGRGGFNNVYGIGGFAIKVGRNRSAEVLPYHRRILQPLVRQKLTGIMQEETIKSNEEDYYGGYGYYYTSNKHNNNKGEFIEIQNIVDTKWYEGMSLDDINCALYDLYRELRKDGIVWTDVKADNVGRLFKKNTTNYFIEELEGKIKKGERRDTQDSGIYDVLNPHELKKVKKEIIVSDRTIGIKDRKEEEPLKAGELVIIDTDHIFPVEEIDLDEVVKTKNFMSKYISFEKIYRQELRQKEEELKKKSDDKAR